MQTEDDFPVWQALKEITIGEAVLTLWWWAVCAAGTYSFFVLAWGSQQ